MGDGRGGQAHLRKEGEETHPRKPVSFDRRHLAGPREEQEAARISQNMDVHRAQSSKSPDITRNLIPLTGGLPRRAKALDQSHALSRTSTHIQATSES